MAIRYSDGPGSCGARARADFRATERPRLRQHDAFQILLSAISSTADVGCGHVPARFTKSLRDAMRARATPAEGRPRLVGDRWFRNNRRIIVAATERKELRRDR